MFLLKSIFGNKLSDEKISELRNHTSEMKKLRELIEEKIKKNGHLKILLIDDDDNEKFYFESRGCTVLYAQKISEGLRLYIQHKHELDGVVMELILSDGDSLGFLEDIKDDPIKKVVLSSMISKEFMSKSKELGAYFFTKPFDLDIALSCLKS